MFVRGREEGGVVYSQTSRSLDSLVQAEIYRLQVTGPADTDSPVQSFADYE